LELMMQTETPTFKISVEGSSRTTILACDGEPIARFYAGRFSPLLLALIERKLNATQREAA
jgi:hypothetical protein